ncbi:MAG: 2OG-Fe(II) oxygenase [Hyphomicrobium sp.]
MNPAIATIPQVDESVQRDAAAHRDAFVHAEPFKHTTIENFFEPGFADRLLAEFPTFDSKLSINEAGKEGGKAVNTRIAQISPAYQELYALIGSPAFLNLVSELSGIPDLLMDPQMFGGGTHENRHGQELDPHVDFNYDQSQNLHRRLNLIVYLNKDWQTSWGGAIEIHSNPRKPYENRVRAFDPLFNRCILFETNEHSWHGFERIDLPADKRHLSRKSISIYLYTKDRPAEEKAPVHATFYVQRFLPKRIAPGYTLTQQDVEELAKLLLRRDALIEMYQKLELTKNAEAKQRDDYIRELHSRARGPLTGYIEQTAAADGLSPDNWAGPQISLPLRPKAPVSELVLRGWRAEAAPPGKLTVNAGGAKIESTVRGGMFEVKLKPSKPLTDSFVLSVTLDAPGNGLPESGDSRDLAYCLVEVRAIHPTPVKWLA